MLCAPLNIIPACDSSPNYCFKVRSPELCRMWNHRMHKYQSISLNQSISTLMYFQMNQVQLCLCNVHILIFGPHEHVPAINFVVTVMSLLHFGQYEEMIISLGRIKKLHLKETDNSGLFQQQHGLRSPKICNLLFTDKVCDLVWVSGFVYSVVHKLLWIENAF